MEKRAFTPRSTPRRSASEEFNELPAHVWPAHATRDPETGVVSIAGVPLTDIAQRYGTPVFVVDEDDFRSRCRDVADAFGGAEFVHYASKAFLTREICRWVHQEGLSLDVASMGELQIALAADFPAARITVHGNNKSREFLTLAVRAGVGHIVVDSSREITDLNEVCQAEGAHQEVVVRVKPGIEAHTHEFIATSHEDQKFGFSLATGSAHAACVAVIDAPHLSFVGVHCHVGSQVFDAHGFTLAAERLLDLMGELHNEFPDATKDMTILDLGGGYGIAYTAEQTALDVHSIAAALLEKVSEHAQELRIPTPKVYVEPGRAIAGPGTVTVYTVGAVKDVHTSPTHIRRYISIDGGMSDNIRPALYQADYEARVVSRLTHGQAIDSRLVGSHCESGDILISDAPWPDDIATGDLLAVAATGAYCYSMTSRYNMMLRPAVVVVKDGTVRVMARRETIDDVLALEPDQTEGTPAHQ